MASEKSRILVIGGTGYIGKFIVEASTKAGHPTFILVRESTVADPVKNKLVESFKNSGVTLVYGDLNDHESLVKAVKKVDIVISTRFLPSEFGVDVDHQSAVEPASKAFDEKAQIRRAIETQRIPFTYVVSNCFAGIFLPTLAQPGDGATPPRDKVTIPGDGNPQGNLQTEQMNE